MKKIVYLSMMSAFILSTSMAFAGGVKFGDDDKYVKIGGRVQLQYHSEDPEVGDKSDEVRFRRLRPYIEGSAHPDWKAKIQWDMGKSDVSLKEAYFQYKGIENMKITVGNKVMPFSRENLTSSKKQQLIERTFVGDHNYGTPEYQVGLHLEGHNEDKIVTWGAALAMGAVDPSTSKLDFDSIASLSKGDDWNEGPIVGARVDFHPLGNVGFSQGNFSDGDLKTTIGLAAFSWSNDDDNVEPGAGHDVDSVTGFEVSAALRVAGLSLDLQYNSFDSELCDAGVTSGMYEDSETNLTNYSVEGGYMIVPEKFEIVAGHQVMDADNYSTEWTITSVGANYFVDKHNIKYQLTYSMNEGVKGKDDSDMDELYIQFQYVF